MKLKRLRGRKVNDHILRRGNVWNGKNLVIRWKMGPPKNSLVRQGVFVGALTSTKLHKSAVIRNRMRRRCREALRIVIKEKSIFPTVQLLLCPKSGSLLSTFSDIRKDVEAFLSFLQTNAKIQE